mgnify:CR=1 FL=1
MINKNVSHWRRNKYFEGLLLFAQALAEGTFYYSYESYKLPALNVECNADTVVSFFNCFTFDTTEYEVVFGINIKAARFFGKLNNIEVRDATQEEKRQLNLQKATDKVIAIPKKAIDIYSAFESAVRHINTFLSFYVVLLQNLQLLDRCCWLYVVAYYNIQFLFLFVLFLWQ